jgi:hypothetical protein
MQFFALAAGQKKQTYSPGCAGQNLDFSEKTAATWPSSQANPPYPATHMRFHIILVGEMMHCA